MIERAVNDVFEYDDFILRTLDHDSGALEAVIARSDTGATFSKRVLYAKEEGNSVAGYVAATGRPYLVEDAREEARWISDLLDVRSAVVVPLKIGEKIMGTFAIEKKEPGAYDRYDMILAGVFAGYITALLDITDLIRIGQRMLVHRVAESVVEEASQPLQNIIDSLEDLRRQNIGDSIAVISRLESIRSSVSAIRDAIMKGASKVGAAVTTPAIPADQTLTGKRILIADDEPSILQSLGDILKGSGCEVEFAHDGMEAVEMVGKQLRPRHLRHQDAQAERLRGLCLHQGRPPRHLRHPRRRLTAMIHALDRKGEAGGARGLPLQALPRRDLEESLETGPRKEGARPMKQTFLAALLCLAGASCAPQHAAVQPSPQATALVSGVEVKAPPSVLSDAERVALESEAVKLAGSGPAVIPALLADIESNRARVPPPGDDADTRHSGRSDGGGVPERRARCRDRAGERAPSRVVRCFGPALRGRAGGVHEEKRPRAGGHLAPRRLG